MSTFPSYIKQTVAYRSGQIPTADEINSYFNLLIEQGDLTTTAVVNHLADEVRHITAEERTAWNAKEDKTVVAAINNRLTTLENAWTDIVVNGAGVNDSLNSYTTTYSSNKIYSTYLSKVDASIAYLSKANATDTYLSKTDANTNYVSKTNITSDDTVTDAGTKVVDATVLNPSVAGSIGQKLASIQSGNNTTTFNTDGSITQTYTNGTTITTVFNTDGSIVETLRDNGVIKQIKTTTFNLDGSISEVIS